MNKRLLVVVFVVVVVVGAVVVFGHHSASPQNQSSSDITFAKQKATSPAPNTPQSQPSVPAPPTDTAVSDAISNQSVSQTISGNFTIVSNQQVVPGWFIAQVLMNDGSGNETAILSQSGDGTLQLIAGPGTAFSQSVLNAQDVPQAVQDEVLVYGN